MLSSLHLVATGLKLFEFNSRLGECPYRLCQEALPLLRPYLTKRVIQVSIEDFRSVLATQTKPCNVTTFSEDLQKQVDGLAVGACAMELKTSVCETLSNKHPAFTSVYSNLMCVVWKGVNTYELYHST